METQKLVLWAIIGILLIAVIYTVFFKASSTGNSVNSGEIDTSDWTENEIMNYEMHGTIPARYQGQTTASSTGIGMVGGC